MQQVKCFKEGTEVVRREEDTAELQTQITAISKVRKSLHTSLADIWRMNA